MVREQRGHRAGGGGDGRGRVSGGCPGVRDRVFVILFFSFRLPSPFFIKTVKKKTLKYYYFFCFWIRSFTEFYVLSLARFIRRAQ